MTTSNGYDRNNIPSNCNGSGNRPCGLLIVIEGLDRSGKSTQCDMLKKRIENELHMNTFLFKYPNRETKIGRLIDEFLREKIQLDKNAIHLLFSANRWEQNDLLIKHLRNGHICVLDRYAYSGVAFSSIKEGMTLDWCKHSDEGLLKPDRVYYMDGKPETLALRSSYGSEVYENLTIQTKVREIFRKMSDQDPIWKCIDAEQNLEVVHETIFEDFCSLVKSKCTHDQSSVHLSTLWT